MAKFKSLSRGTQIVLVTGPLLFFSLFLTWQNVAVNYGRAGVARLPLDGWDAWGLLLGLLVLSTSVRFVRTTSVRVERTRSPSRRPHASQPSSGSLATPARP